MCDFRSKGGIQIAVTLRRLMGCHSRSWEEISFPFNEFFPFHLSDQRWEGARLRGVVLGPDRPLRGLHSGSKGWQRPFEPGCDPFRPGQEGTQGQTIPHIDQRTTELDSVRDVV
jgi:hypothetical protein